MRGIKQLLAIVVVMAGQTAITAAQSTVAVVVSPRNPVSAIGLADLRKVFAGERRFWSDGSSVKLFTRTPGTLEHDTMLKLIGMSEAEYRQYWRTRVYQGQAQSEPVALPSNGMQKEALQTYPGAIALVSASEIKPGMKVLKVDGKLPEDPGYPLQN